MTCPISKSELRRELHQRRNRLLDRDIRSAAICERIARLTIFETAWVVHSYLPIRSEVDVKPLLISALAEGKGIVVPIVEPGDPNLSHVWLSSLQSNELEIGEFGILQPRKTRPARIGAWNVMLVPLLAFDRFGRRLGYGKGYYDRLLAVAPCPTIGIAFATQEVDELPYEPHDRNLDWIVTEDEVIEIQGSPYYFAEQTTPLL